MVSEGYPFCGPSVDLVSVVSADPTGTALIVDGDTITISGNKIRLSRLDTPKNNQTCTKASITWRCDYEAAKTLRDWT